MGKLTQPIIFKRGTAQEEPIHPKRIRYDNGWQLLGTDGNWATIGDLQDFQTPDGQSLPCAVGLHDGCQLRLRCSCEHHIVNQKIKENSVRLKKAPRPSKAKKKRKKRGTK